MSRSTYAKIDLVALHKNLDSLCALAPNSKSLAVVKANAYGHGAVDIAKSIEARVDMFAVAFIDEAIQLREAGLVKPILVLQGPHHADDLQYTTPLNLYWMLHNTVQIDWLASLSDVLKKEEIGARIWLKFDTGMHRLGFSIADFDAVLQHGKAYISEHTVIATHLACADEENESHAQAQIKQFLDKAAKTGLKLSIANSAATIAHEQAKQDINRLGIALYGSSPFSLHDSKHAQASAMLQSVMSLHAQVIAIRDIPKGDTVGYGATWRATRKSRIATVSIGYGDGYPRHAPTGTPAYCRGERIRLVGRVSMDMLTFDVTDVTNVALFDEVELWGKHLSINEVAEHIGTIGYELMTRVSARVPRRVVHV